MKKLMAVAAMLALVLAVSVPALAAQVVQAPTETFVSGTNANNAGAVQGGGDNSNTCSAQENFNNSGGLLNQPSSQQYVSDIGTGELFLGPAFTNAPAQTTPCEPTVQQAASSSSQ
jgi:opacity protein-like surface antigen